jgi:hypothetical protein
MDDHHVRGDRYFGRIDGFLDAVSGAFKELYMITAADQNQKN